ncbi:MAG: hypothetical protein KIS73_22795 [Enhydrobacter sp.]|nr:hypothetical protein [Enhydrobacter sp.]
MPTGIEETLGAFAALIVQAAATSALSGNPDPNGAIEAGDTAVFAPSPILDVDVQEGTSGTVAVVEAPVDAGGNSGASRAPVDGDRPPPPPPSGGVYERPAIYDGQPATEYFYTDPDVVVGEGPATPPPPDASGDAGPAPGSNPAESGVPPPPTIDPPWQPPMNVPPAAPSIVEPPLTAPIGISPPPADDGGGIGVPADWADAWERNHEYSWAKFLWDKSCEELNRAAKKAVEDALGEWQRGTDENGEDASELEQSVRGVGAAALTTGFDVVFGMFVLPVLDPSSVARGYLRTGVASAHGVEDIQQGRVLEGSAKIVGEVSAVVLTVAGGVRAVQAKGAPPAPGESTVTVFLEKGGVGKEAVVGAHNSVRVTSPAKGAAGAVDKFTDAIANSAPTIASDVVAQVRNKPFNAKMAEGKSSFTRPVSPEAARRAAGFADAASNMKHKGLESAIADFAGSPKEMILRALDTGRGRTGPFSTLGEHCATYAAAVARSGGIVASGRFGPHAMYMMFKYGGAPGAGLLATGIAVGMLGNQGDGGTPGPAPPPPD